MTHDTYVAARVRIAGGTGGSNEFQTCFRPKKQPRWSFRIRFKGNLPENNYVRTWSCCIRPVYGSSTGLDQNEPYNSRMQQICWVQKSSRAWPRWAVYQIRFYTDDVVAIYLKPITSVPGDAFADQLRSSSFLGFPSGFKAVSMFFPSWFE